MNKTLLFSLTAIGLLFFSNLSFGQTLDLGEILTPFEAYTGAGAITNGGQVTGDAGSNDGIISGVGFDSANGYTGTTYHDDATTVQARVDLLRVYIHLSDVFVTFPGSHAATFGGAETIFPGVYSIPGAGSLGGPITLDGLGDPNAYFILKFEGALTVGVGTEIKLTNGTRAANVFWIAEGAISVGSDSILKGTFFSHPGALSLGTNVNIEGRLFSSEGAITIGAGSVASMPQGNSNIPITCLGGCDPNPLVDVLGSVDQYALFTSAGAVANAATSGIVGNIGSNNGALSGFGTSTHVGFFNIPSDVTAQAVADLDNAYAQLIALTNTELGHLPAFGSGETVSPGVYYIGGAGSLAGTITLDANHDPNAIFVFKFNGAFSVAAQSKVIFRNGTRRCNVFWISEGATNLGTFTYMKGTIIAHGGAASMGANGNLEGRLLSTAGAIGFSTGVVYNDTLCFEPIIVQAQSYEGCLEDSPSLTSIATVNTTSQNVIWYDAEIGGNVVEDPTLEGVGTETYWARAYNGAFYSDNIDSSTLTIVDCSLVINAIDDTYRPIQVLDEITIFDGLVTINDILDNSPVTNDNAFITPVSDGPLSIDTDGTLSLEANTESGTYTIIYSLCQLGSGATICDTATVTVIVAIIDAVDDITEPVNGLTGGNTEPLSLNDTITIDEEIVAVIGTELGNVTLTGLTVPEGLILNEDGTVTIAPNTPAGEYEVEYQICEIDNPINCDSATATIVVSAPVIDAVDDITEEVNGLTGGNTTALTLNDTLNDVPAIIGEDTGNVILIGLTATEGLTLPEGLTLNEDGTVAIAPNTPTGDYEVIYQICEVNNPTNCDSANATIAISAPVIDAVIDTTEEVNGLTGGITEPLTDNDILNEVTVIIGEDPGNVILIGLNVPDELTLNEDGTVTIPGNTPAADYEVDYKICEVNNPTNCDSAIATIAVSAPVIDAVEDIIDPVNGLIGGLTDPLTDNDTLNVNPAEIGTQVGSVILTGLNVPTEFTLNTDGTVTIPPNTPAGDYDVEYQICEVSNPTNCDSVTSTIIVSAPVIEALVDTLGPINGTSGEDTTSLTNNDTLNVNQVVIGTEPGNVILTGISVPSGFTLNEDGRVTIPPNTPANTYLIEYQICEVNNPGNCDSVASIIEVEAPYIEAVSDTAGPIGGSTGEINVINVLTNDILNNSAVNLTDVNLTTITPNAALILNADGSVDVVANTPTGTYTLIYQICEKSNLTNCSQAEVAIEVFRETPDFTPTIDIDALVFLPDGLAKDLIVNVAEVKDAPSDGQIVLKITKGSAFIITYNGTTTNSSVNGGIPVNNNDWIINENSFFITMTLKPSKTIAANSFSSIGFSINRGSDVPTQTNQSITITIVNGSGGDSEPFNNTYNTVVKAQ